jgi:hypothetical protein
MIPSVQLDPGLMSRGAIQHLIPSDSRRWQIASAIDLSSLEWLIKTFDCMTASAAADYNSIVATGFIFPDKALSVSKRLAKRRIDIVTYSKRP